ncbi:Hypothetical protein CINCED_3A022700 [Cinara cedri]|uniref:Uncharacterized protein n=1 Tax=Cinara cedri TaxID=506608 RepID=A0A5E4M1S3_9HEMI|nr:Hypothetical protein CINCED_3A022700 [Cinara cedri]
MFGNRSVFVIIQQISSYLQIVQSLDGCGIPLQATDNDTTISAETCFCHPILLAIEFWHFCHLSTTRRVCTFIVFIPTFPYTYSANIRIKDKVLEDFNEIEVNHAQNIQLLKVQNDNGIIRVNGTLNWNQKKMYSVFILICK